MEHALGVSIVNYSEKSFAVLILIVMEHALGEGNSRSNAIAKAGLNPYCNGTCSRR